MKITRNLGTGLLAFWFILSGLIALFNLSFAFQPLVMGLLACAVGLCLFLGR